MKSYNPLESGFSEKNVSDNSHFIIICLVTISAAMISLYLYHQLSEKIEKD